jgi:hypothetical protein
MAIRKLVLMLVLSVLALSSFVIAQDQSLTQHRVTVQTRSGERVSGLLQDVENGIVFVRVSEHDQRRLPIGDVVLIDFVGGASGLPDSELSVAARSEHLAVLRNGSSWTGQFVDVRGGEASAAPGTRHSLVFRVGGEERRVDLDQVGRIYLGNYPYAAAAGSNAPTAIPSGSIRVPANTTWVPTGIIVRRGDRLAFNASGEVQLSDDGGDVAQPAGSTRGRRAPAGAPMPNELAGALVGRIGNSAAFGIGNLTAPLTMPSRGELFLGVNDDHVNDNRGEFVVQIQNAGATRQR